jgi:hypothetical protein
MHVYTIAYNTPRIICTFFRQRLIYFISVSLSEGGVCIHFHMHTMQCHYRQHPASSRLHLPPVDAPLYSPSSTHGTVTGTAAAAATARAREEKSIHSIEHCLYSPVINTHSNCNDVFSFARSIVIPIPDATKLHLVISGCMHSKKESIE